MSLTLPQHGTLIEYLDQGIYIIGPSGSGKSETALQLIRDGARLICDDAPLIELTTDGQVQGTCPENFIGQVFIHDLGIINIAHTFGKEHIKEQQPIDFIIEFKLTGDYYPINAHTEYQYWQFQSRQIPGLTLQHSAGRNKALLIHSAILQFKAKNLTNR